MVNHNQFRDIKPLSPNGKKGMVLKMKKNKVCAVMLSLIMVFGVFAPMTVAAADNDGYS